MTGRDKFAVHITAKFIVLIFSFFALIGTINVQADTKNTERALIIEVAGDVQQIAKEIRQYYPSLEIINTYDLLLQAIALKGDEQTVREFAAETYVLGVYPVQTYVQLQTDWPQSSEIRKLEKHGKLPNEINETSYTGKGVKVAVIDTGIDLKHPDLQRNYRGGYDLVDLDDVPQETTIEEGMPTSHGTHVAGIIAANGKIKGVAPDAEIYAYRALGPGGVGTSVQIIAALEEAVKQGVDIINLSLGSDVNGPDYPTSRAVNEAAKHGIAIVVANGNAGPAHWTVGSPATASGAFSVGAYQDEKEFIYFVDQETERTMRLYPLTAPTTWDFPNRHEVTHENDPNVFGKIVFVEKWERNVLKQIARLQQAGAKGVITQQKDALQLLHVQNRADITLPLAYLSTNDATYLRDKIAAQRTVHVHTIAQPTTETIANFSSRGPVLVNWQIKPNLIAPGVDIISTVPGGYGIYSGTSMAAPYVTGAIALMKEAHPDWPNQKIFAALETYARKLYNQSGTLIPPYVQGAGLLQIDAAIHSDTIIENSLLTFGKIKNVIERKRAYIVIHNEADEIKHFYMKQPKPIPGINFTLPTTFSVNANSTKRIPISVTVNKLLLNNDVVDGTITLHNETEKFLLHYIVLNDVDHAAAISGFHFQLHPLKEERYAYQFYASEDVQWLQVKLYDPETLLYETTLLELTNVQAGFHKGELSANTVKANGFYYAVIIVERKNGTLETYEMNLQL